MALDIAIRYENLRREPDGSVSGKLVLEVSIEAGPIKEKANIDARNFHFPRGGEQKIYDQKFEAGEFSLQVTATVHERNAGQCCTEGHVHADGPIGGGIGQDLDPNCKPIPEG